VILGNLSNPLTELANALENISVFDRHLTPRELGRPLEGNHVAGGRLVEPIAHHCIIRWRSAV
jgi:hypothetical protein